MKDRVSLNTLDPIYSVCTSVCFVISFALFVGSDWTFTAAQWQAWQSFWNPNLTCVCYIKLQCQCLYEKLKSCHVPIPTSVSPQLAKSAPLFSRDSVLCWNPSLLWMKSDWIYKTDKNVIIAAQRRARVQQIYSLVTPQISLRSIITGYFVGLVSADQISKKKKTTWVQLFPDYDHQRGSSRVVMWNFAGQSMQRALQNVKGTLRSAVRSSLSVFYCRSDTSEKSSKSADLLWSPKEC